MLNCYSSFHLPRGESGKAGKTTNLLWHSHLNWVFFFFRSSTNQISCVTYIHANKHKEWLVALKINQQLKLVSVGFYCGHSLLSLHVKACPLDVQYKRESGLFARLDRKSSIFMRSRRWYGFYFQSRRQIMSRYDLSWAAFIPEIEMRLWYTEWNQFTVSLAKKQTAVCLNLPQSIKSLVK